jgi:hypothetical protein
MLQRRIPGILYTFLILLIPVQVLCRDAPRDFHFGLSGQTSVALTDESIIDVTINGEGLFKVIFDTGANFNILNPEVIAQLNLPASNIVAGPISGLRAGHLDAKPFHVNELRIGDLTLNDQDFFNIAIPLPKSYAIVGAIGFELFSRVLIKANYEHHQLVFFDPARFTYTGSGQKLDLQPNPRSIVVKAAHDSVNAVCCRPWAYCGPTQPYMIQILEFCLDRR